MLQGYPVNILVVWVFSHHFGGNQVCLTCLTMIPTVPLVAGSQAQVCSHVGWAGWSTFPRCFGGVGVKPRDVFLREYWFDRTNKIKNTFFFLFSACDIISYIKGYIYDCIWIYSLSLYVISLWEKQLVDWLSVRICWKGVGFGASVASELPHDQELLGSYSHVPMIRRSAPPTSCRG